MFHDFLHWYFSKKALRYWYILVIDCALVMFSGYVGHYLEIGGDRFAHHFWPMTWGLLCCTVFYLLAFVLLHTYRGIIRYSSFIDLQRVAVAVLTGTVVSGVVCPFGRGLCADLYFPGLKALCTMLVLSILLLWAERVAVKRMFDTLVIDSALPMAIYGARAGGISLAQSLFSQQVRQYRLRVFISDAEDMAGSYLLGKKVLLNERGIVGELVALGVRVILVSPLKSERFRANPQFVEDLLAANIKIMMMPAAEEWDGKSSLTPHSLHEVQIEDLLPRDKIEVDMQAIGELLAGRKILITGAAGSIGSEMVRQVAAFKPSEMVLIDQAETPMHDVRLLMARRFPDIKCETIVSSIANKEHMEVIFRQHQPEYVFHAAAYKHVPMMEDNPGMAVQNNIAGTRIIADLAVKYGTRKFVMISTDKAVNPTNVMGCSKRICEIYCQSLNKAIVEGKVQGVTQFVTTRFGNVLGSNGSVIPIFKDQIAKGGPVTVTHPDIIRYFMLIPEACKLVLEAGTMGKGGEIFVFDMGQPVKIVDLARRMINLSGTKNVEIKFTGLRDGEKLYEELLSAKENTKPTVHPKIMVATVREYDYATACANEERLLQASYSFNDMEIVRIMKEIVPEYKSQSSKYQILD